MTERDNKILNFIAVLYNQIPDRVCKDTKRHIYILKENKDYNNFQEYIRVKIKELFDMEVEFTDDK